MELLGRATYNDEVQTQANVLESYAQEDIDSGEFDDAEQAIIENVGEVLNGHSWFSEAKYGPALYGLITEYSDADGDSMRTLNGFYQNPLIAMRQIAIAVFEHDVIEAANPEHIHQ